MGKTINSPDGKTTEHVEIVDKENESSREAYALLRRSGEKVKPHGMAYVGSAAFHMYRNHTDGLLPPSYSFISVTPIGNASEGMVIMGFKRLQSRIFQFFGRKEPEVRT